MEWATGRKGEWEILIREDGRLSPAFFVLPFAHSPSHPVSLSLFTLLHSHNAGKYPIFSCLLEARTRSSAGSERLTTDQEVGGSNPPGYASTNSRFRRLILAPISTMATFQAPRLHERIVLDPDVMVGKPVIRGTRLTVEFILGLLAQGATEDEILGEYQTLTREDIRACLNFASESVSDSSFMPLAV